MAGWAISGYSFYMINVRHLDGAEVVATVGGAGRGSPALTISARHNPKKNDFRPAQFFFFFFSAWHYVS